MSDSVDPLTRAIELSIEFESAGGEKDVEAFLAEHEDLREILEPLICQDDIPDDRAILGDYELIRELGRGGMGVVYEAIQTLLGRTVALKLLPPHRALSPRSLAMFRREATLAASLAHPGIAKVLDFQEIDGQLALAMELIDGIPLDDVLEQLEGRAPGSLTAADFAKAAGATLAAERAGYEMVAVELARQMAEALAHAHSRGIVHRDVKPGNILVTPDGRAVLTDFGLAREEGMIGVTRTGEFAGTYQYAAPEQLEGRLDELDGRTDVYSLGATLYEMLTLKRPLEAESLTELVLMIRREDPAPPSRHNPRVTPDLEAVLLCALEKDRRRRYATAGELATDLANVLTGRPVKARRLSTTVRSMRWVNRNRLITAFLVMLAVSLTTISLFWADTTRAHALASHHLQRYENIWVGAAIDKLVARANRACPPWPGQLEELEALVRIAGEDLPATIPQQLTALAELREGYVSDGPVPRDENRPVHPAQARIEELLDTSHRLDTELRTKGVSPAAAEAARSEVVRMQARVEELRALVAESDRVRIPDPKAAALHDRLESQLYRLGQVERELLPDLRFRAGWAAAIRQRSIDDHAARWQEAAKRVAADQRFAGQAPLAPQLGLVPLGPDPQSGLEEFAHLLSGQLAERGADRKLTLSTEHGIVFVLMPGGKLDSSVTRNLRLDPFFIGKHEVSRAQWERLARGVPGLRWRDGGIAEVRNTGEMDKPVMGVSWFMCRDLLARSGLEIPTTAQWEYCMRFDGGAYQSQYPKVCNLRDRSYLEAAVARGDPRPRVLGWDDGYASLAPITAMEPTPGGLYHLLGNASEWCRDMYFYKLGTPRDGDGLRESSGVLNAPRIINGGDFLGIAPALMFERKSPHTASRNLGIRASRRVLGEEVR